jgi:hypothetical protein
VATTQSKRERTVGYIHLRLRRDSPRGWLVDVERIDPYGGDPFQQSYWFEERAAASFWFKGIKGNEDILALHQMTDLDPIANLPGTTFL